MIQTIQTASFTLTTQQTKALELMSEFLRSTKNFFLLLGYAGSGKSTIIFQLIKILIGEGKKIALTAPTNKAVRVLQRMASNNNIYGVDFFTIHQLLGLGLVRRGGDKVEEFPRLPEVTVQQAIHLPAETLKVGLRGSLFATTSDEAKLILTGVHIKLEQDILELAATDGHRLAVLQASTQGIAGKKKQPDNTDDAPLSLSFTVPAKALRELERILEMRTSTDPVALYYKKEEEVVAFYWGKQRLVSRCLEGQYPAYPELLKHNFQQQITLEKAPLVKALERIAVLADKKEKTVKLYFNSEDQQLSLFMARDFGEGEELIPACISGESLYICFNIKYLLDAVKAIRSEKVQMQLTSSDGPAIVVPEGNRDKPHVLIDVKYLLMPVVKESKS